MLNEARRSTRFANETRQTEETLEIWMYSSCNAEPIDIDQHMICEYYAHRLSQAAILAVLSRAKHSWVVNHGDIIKRSFLYTLFFLFGV